MRANIYIVLFYENSKQKVFRVNSIKLLQDIKVEKDKRFNKNNLMGIKSQLNLTQDEFQIYNQLTQGQKKIFISPIFRNIQERVRNTPDEKYKNSQIPDDPSSPQFWRFPIFNNTSYDCSQNNNELQRILSQATETKQPQKEDLQSIKLHTRQTQLECLYISQKVQVQIEQVKLRNLEENHKQQIAKIRKNYDKQIEQLKDNQNWLQNKIRQKNEEIKTNTQKIKEQDKNNRNASNKIIELFKIINQKDQTLRKPAENNNLLLLLSEFEKKLNQKTDKYQKDHILLQNDFIELINYIKTGNKQLYFYPNYVKNGPKFFENAIKWFQKNRIEGQYNPNQEIYIGLIQLLTSVDTTFESILNVWNDCLQDKNTQSKQEIKKLENKIKEADQKMKSIEEREKNGNIKFQEKIEGLQIQKSKLNENKSILQQKIKKMKGESDQLLSKIIKLTIEFQQKLKRDNEQYQTQKQQLSNKIDQLTSQNNKHNLTIKSQQQRINQMNEKNTRLEAELKKVSEYLRLSKQQQKKLQNDITTLQNEKSTLDRRIIDLSENIQGLKISSDNKSKSNQGQIQKLNMELNEIKNKLNYKSQQCNELKQHVKQQQKQICILDEKPKFIRCFTQYFGGSILNLSTQQDTEWFVNSLESGMGRRIKQTHLLYRFDLQNKTTFHYYIDHKPNLVLIVKMQNGQKIAGYSQPALQPKTDIDRKPGMMFAFNNRTVFHVKTQASTKYNKTEPKPMTYDEYYIIWGNSDIRIRSGSHELFSNYSTASCSYEQKGNNNPNIADLFLIGERDTKLKDYEIFQVEFQE